MTPLELERAEAIVRSVQGAISDDRRNYHDAIAWTSFIKGYPREYVAECWRHRANLRAWLETTPMGGM